MAFANTTNGQADLTDPATRIQTLRHHLHEVVIITLLDLPARKALSSCRLRRPWPGVCPSAEDRSRGRCVAVSLFALVSGAIGCV
jgi:hypothetical protein